MSAHQTRRIRDARNAKLPDPDGEAFCPCAEGGRLAHDKLPFYNPAFTFLEQGHTLPFDKDQCVSFVGFKECTWSMEELHVIVSSTFV